MIRANLGAFQNRLENTITAGAGKRSPWSEKIKEFLDEAKINPGDKKKFEDYAYEIAKNFMDDAKKRGLEITGNVLKEYVLRTLISMGHSKDNPNYKNLEKFMPKNFDK